MIEDREYQGRAERSLLWHLQTGRRPLLVAPTGAGKTVMLGRATRALPGRTGWITHTKDLVEQSARKLRELGLRVGTVAASRDDADPLAPVQVISIQTLLSRECDLRLENVVLDEAHHFLAEEWRGAVDTLQAERLFGGTATPERGDGQPLGDIFNEIVVAAQYSELIAKGYLVPLRVLRPDTELAKGLAQKILAAYLERGEGKRGFVFVRTVEEAAREAALACQAGVGASVIEADTPAEDRRRLLQALGTAAVRLLYNVYALTEGVDVPEADICVLGRNFVHTGTMLQATGRVLRPAPCKDHAMLLDLPGVTWRLGIPIEDREYSLTGEAVRRSEKGLALRVCMSCGMTFQPSGKGECPRCGHRNLVKDPAKLRIYNKELAEVFAGTSTPEWAKRAEWERLRRVAADRGYPQSWVDHQYRELFGHGAPETKTVGEDEKRAEYQRLVELAEKRSYNAGWAAHRYKALFGAFPPSSWKLRRELDTVT